MQWRVLPGKTRADERFRSPAAGIGPFAARETDVGAARRAEGEVVYAIPGDVGGYVHTGPCAGRDGVGGAQLSTPPRFDRRSPKLGVGLRPRRELTGGLFV